MDFISVIEKTAGKTAIKQMMGMQPGDVVCTYADTGRLEKDFGYKPSTSIEEGIQKFYDWYVGYFNKNSFFIISNSSGRHSKSNFKCSLFIYNISNK